MVRKRLSDLLRDEAQRSLDAPNPQPASDSDRPDPAPSTGDRKPTGKPAGARRAASSAKPAAAPKSTPRAAKPAAPPPQESSVSENSPVEELQDTIAELQASLRQATHAETVLREELAKLEAELAQKQDLINHLKEELERSRQHQAEADEARTMILKLSENNIQLTQELEQLRQAKTEQQTQGKQAIATTVATPAPSRQAAPKPTTGLAMYAAAKPAPTPTTNGLATAGSALRQILRHPIQPQQPSTALTNDDIGWVD